MSFRRVCLLHGLPLAAIWSVYLVAFWPGMMTEDSLSQWWQMVTLQLLPYHTPIHTLTNWLITRVWFSPAAVVIVQIAALALGLCGVLWMAARDGAPARLRWATAVWLALMPATGFLAITVWKDIPYTVAHLAVAALSFPIARTRGAALRRPGLLSGLTLALVAMAVYRHNGLPVTAAYLAFLLIVSAGGLRWRTFALAAATAVGIVAVHESVRVAFHLGSIPRALQYQTPLHQVSAVIASGAAIDAGDRRVLEPLMPLAQWKARYRCFQMFPLIAEGGLDWDALERAPDPFLRTWFHLVTRHPLVVLRHQACVTGMLWQPGGHEVFIYTDIPSWGRLYGLQIESKSPPTRAWLTAMYERSIAPPIGWLLWGPALQWWLLVGSAAFVVSRQVARRGATRSDAAWAILPFVPAIAHTLVLFVFLPSPEFRLQYPGYLVGTLSPLMASALRREPAA